MNNEDYTNFPGIWKDIGFDKSKDIFYKVNYEDAHWDKLFDLPAFNTANKIFVIDQESNSHQYIEKDNRIQVWDSTISDHPRIHTYLFWFNWVREVEEHMQLAKKLTPVNCKQTNIAFDALLGSLRTHKWFVLENINRHTPDKFITGACKPQYQGIPNGWIPGGHHENGNNVLNFNSNQTAGTACFLPYDIYNKTWYSLVCETRGTGKNIFFTEKTAKPMAASRLFILFGQYKQLHALHKLGFKTFDGIIDESYDLESDDTARYKKAWKQIEFLLDQNPIEIYNECYAILEHNKKLLFKTNWDEQAINQMIKLNTPTTT